MGRPRKAPDERRLEGNPGKRPIPVELFTPEGATFVPKHLSADAQACAETIVRSFKTKQLTAADTYALAAFSTAWAWHKAATEAMSAPDFEPIVEGSTGQQSASPWFRIMNDQSRVMLAWAGKLYLTPADRASLPAEASEERSSEFDGLLGLGDGAGGRFHA